MLFRLDSRQSAVHPSLLEAARARLERVVAPPGPGWLPADPLPPAGAQGSAVPAHRRDRRRRFDGRALAALGVLGLLSLLLAGWYVWRSWPVSADVPDRSEIVVAAPDTTRSPLPPSTSPGAPVAASASPTPSAGSVVVHVAGAVVRPGIVTLSAGARVADAVQAAGGALPGTDMSGVNLARVLVDGEQVLVGLPAGAGAPPDPTPASSAGSGAALLDLNSATVDELQTLPGVGPVLAQRIVNWRTENGRFTSVEELQEVDGIGEQRLAELRSAVRV